MEHPHKSRKNAGYIFHEEEKTMFPPPKPTYFYEPQHYVGGKC